MIAVFLILAGFDELEKPDTNIALFIIAESLALFFCIIAGIIFGHNGNIEVNEDNTEYKDNLFDILTH